MRQLPIWIVVVAFVAAAVGCTGGGEPGATATGTVVPTVAATGTSAVTATSTVVGRSTVAPSVSATAVVTAGATGTSTVAPARPEAAAVEAAREALARWLGPVGDAGSIEVVSVEAVEWPNGCLGLSRAGQMCTEALVPGFRVALGLGVAVYEVRTDRTGAQVAWAPQVQILVRFLQSSTNVAVFETDDCNEVPTRLVPGTGFGVDLLTLSQGTPVGIAVADGPQAGMTLLVWVEAP